MKYLLGLFVAIGLASVQLAGAEESGKHIAKPVRIGGNYRIDSIERQSDRSFRIIFEATTKTGKFDSLVLDADHINFSVEQGQTVRLSAEVLASSVQETVEVTQVLLYLPHRQGEVPIWMMSKKGMGRDLNAAKYLEMHAPTTDYLLF